MSKAALESSKSFRSSVSGVQLKRQTCCLLYNRRKVQCSKRLLQHSTCIHRAARNCFRNLKYIMNPKHHCPLETYIPVGAKTNNKQTNTLVNKSNREDIRRWCNGRKQKYSRDCQAGVVAVAMISCNLQHGGQRQPGKREVLNQRCKGSGGVSPAEVLRENVPDQASQCKGLEAEVFLGWSGNSQKLV